MQNQNSHNTHETVISKGYLDSLFYLITLMQVSLIYKLKQQSRQNYLKFKPFNLEKILILKDCLNQCFSK